MRAWVVLLALLLACPAAGQARDDRMETVADIQDLAVAKGPTRGGSGVFAAATLDNASTDSATTDHMAKVFDPHAEVWYLWDRSGRQIWADHADRKDCENDAFDPCVAHARFVAVSDDGQRMVVASDLPPGLVLSSSIRTQLVFVEASKGIVERYQMGPSVTDMALSADGGRLAVLVRDFGSITNPGTSRVLTFGWPNGTTMTPLMNDRLPGSATSLAMTPDGTEIGVAGSQYWHYPDGWDHETSTRNWTASARAVAMQDGPWSVVGFTGGTVRLFNSNFTAAGDLWTAYRHRPANDTITSVAIAGQVFAAGDTNGTLHLFRLHERGAPAGEFMGSFPVADGTVQDLQLTRTGNYLAFRSGSEVQFHRWDGKDLTRIWSDTPGGPLGTLAMDATGDLVAVAAGNEVVVYEVHHRVVGFAGDRTVAHGDDVALNVHLRNEGNRAEFMTLEPRVPAGWNASVSQRTLHLEPGQGQDVVMRVAVPQATTPGGYLVHLDHASGHEERTTVRIDVPRDRRLELDFLGSPSVGIEPGQTVEFVHQLRNTGNVDAPGSLLVEAPPDWGVEVTPRNVDLAPGEGADMVVALTAPEDLRDGHSGTFRVRPAGHPGSVELTATAGAVFGVALETPKGFQADLGAETPFNLTVVNKGNAPDTADLKVAGVPDGWVLLFENMQQEMRVLDLEAGEERQVEGLMIVADDAVVGQRYILEFDVASLAEPASREKEVLIVSVGAAAAEETCAPGACAQEAVAAGVWMALVLVGVAAWSRRRV